MRRRRPEVLLVGLQTHRLAAILNEGDRVAQLGLDARDARRRKGRGRDQHEGDARLHHDARETKRCRPRRRQICPCTRRRDGAPRGTPHSPAAPASKRAPAGPAPGHVARESGRVAQVELGGSPHRRGAGAALTRGRCPKERGREVAASSRPLDAWKRGGLPKVLTDV